MNEKQMSPNWKKILDIKNEDDLHSKCIKALGNILGQFPYHEGFPEYPCDWSTTKFGLLVPIKNWYKITEIDAKVGHLDILPGKYWKITDSKGHYKRGMDKALVIAWYEK